MYPSVMSDMENHCRICRGEGTDLQPLLHPCKCRGSIKYIHQDCLLEWLKHSNKSTKKCDICNTPYKFKTIYDPQMPERMPIKFIWEKFTQIVSVSSIKSVSIFLYVTCLIMQVPLFWKFIGRVYTWAIDGNLPTSNPTFVEALLFGELNFEDYDIPSSSSKSALFKFRKFLDYTYFSGIRYILMYVIIHIALFVEHEWVVRDDGYTKLLLKKVGKEPRTKLVDMLQQALNGLRNDGAEGNADANANLQRLEMIARAINDLQEQPNNNRREEVLRRVIEDDHIDLNDVQGQHNYPRFDINVNGNRNSDNESSDGEIELENERRTIFLRAEDEVQQREQQEHAPEREADQPGRGRMDPIQPIQPIQQDQVDINDLVEEEPEQEAFDDIDAAANNIGNGDIFELLGISLNLTTPLLLMFMCDVIISVYLFITYLIPHMLGNVFVAVSGGLIRLISSTFLNRVYSLFSINNFTLKIFNSNNGVVEIGNDFVDFTLFTVFEVIIKPFTSTLYSLFIKPQSPQPSLIERMILLTFGYSIIAFGIYKFMNSLVSGPKPIMGTPRKIYKVLFEVASTAKVFLIFAIEIFFFPVYCGWLLDFCVAPILLPKFTKTTNDGSSTTFMILLSSNLEVLQIHYIRVILYWASGTLYMLFFALFVGMVRGKILRPGVLFFIRSPDDPNARLVHDALVKPLMLQLSRIYLSAKVYTGFILIGIGGVTWGLRYLVTPPKEVPYNVMLPLQIPSFNTVFISSIIVGDILINKSLITKYCQDYWSRVFEISAHKLRLSHFILGKPISQERGYVVYRNVFQQLSGAAQPDYSRPVTYKDALRIFEENPQINACFVPDGNYVRAPDNDTVSRKFIKKLFVPVTKDDKLLSSNDETKSTNDEYETDSSDEEINNDNAYTIVYRPPNFKFRCLGLIAMLWIFAVILILSIAFIGLIIGRPVVRASSILFDAIDKFEIISEIKKIFEFGSTDFDWRLADLSSIFIGLKFELVLLQYIDKKLNSHSTNVGANEVPIQGNEDAQRFLDIGRVIVPRLGEGIILSFLIYTLSTFFWVVWIISVHKLCIDFPVRLYTGFTFERNTNIFLEFLVSKVTVPIHLFVSLWTIIPFAFYITVDLRNGVINGLGLRHNIWKSGLMAVLYNFVLLHVPSVILIIMNHKGFKIDRINEKDVYIWSVTLVTFIIIKLSICSVDLFKKINEQVKNEKYVRGRAIENIELPEDEDE